ncbi:MAG TPA: hypothetical protein VIV60_29310 [Polyangiaceae bacterium]
MRLSSLIVGYVVLLGLLVVANASGEERLRASPKAKEHFAAGLAHLDDPAGAKYEEAYREFRAAYAETPSYEIAVDIGYCAFHLERDAEALEMYEVFLAKANENEISKKKRVQMEKDVQSLRAGLVRVSLKMTPDKVSLVDERFPSKGPTIVNRYQGTGGQQELGIHPGSHRITITADGFEPQSWEFEAEPGTKHAREFKLVPVAIAKASAPGIPAAPPDDAAASGAVVPPEIRKEGTSNAVYVGVAVTSGLAIATTLMGIVTEQKKSDFDELNKDGLHPQEAQSMRDETQRYGLFTDIGLGAAVLSGGITAYLYFNQPKPALAGPTVRTSWNISPRLGPKQGGLSLSGKF